MLRYSLYRSPFALMASCPAFIFLEILKEPYLYLKPIFASKLLNNDLLIPQVNVAEQFNELISISLFSLSN